MLGAKNFVNVWNMERHQKKDHGLTEKDYVVENSAGIAIFTTQQLSLEINIFIFMICTTIDFASSKHWIPHLK